MNPDLLASLGIGVLGLASISIARSISNLRATNRAHQEHLKILGDRCEFLEQRIRFLENSLSPKAASKPLAKAPAKPRKRSSKKVTPEEQAAFEAERKRLLESKDFFPDD